MNKHLKNYLFPIVFLIVVLCVHIVSAQTILVNPTGVNVNSQDPTVVFLTFGQIPVGYQPAEALWCGQLVAPPPPALGLACRPDTIYGALPVRHDLSRSSGTLGLTDIMSIPPAVVRRAFQTADAGGDAGFFYVRRFVSTLGDPDQYVAVTCRMAGGGARVPFALTDVKYVSTTDEPIVFLKRGEKLPVKGVEIRYNGTGRLKGRWELVLPGEELPTDRDLLTESSLPIEERSGQRRFTQIERFNHFLPPSGKFVLGLPNVDKLPINADGQYLLLLRIEAVDDKEADSSLSTIGVGPGVVHSGAAAGFPIPAFKFFVVGNASADWTTSALVAPADDLALVQNAMLPVFTWRPMPDAAYYRIEFLDSNSVSRFQAIQPGSVTAYRAPSWLPSKFTGRTIGWKIVSLDEKGAVIAETSVRTIRLPE